jgi:glucose-1-phosphate thymidylyltransferase
MSAHMKAIIPLAGKGTRLLPHTHVTPKPLINVAGLPVMSYILDDIIDLGIQEVVFVVGYLREAIEAYVAEAYPEITAHYVLQDIQDGTAGAVALAEPFIDDEVLILFVDTISDADLARAHSVDKNTGGIIWVKEVEDYQRYGVILTDENDHMVSIVEKPPEPISNLANIGIYYIREWQLLFEGIARTLASEAGPSGEFYLTDAFQHMVDQGSKIQIVPVNDWYDCGKLETLIDTNRYLLERDRAEVEDSAVVERSNIIEPVRIESDAYIIDCTIGPNVTVGSGARIEESKLTDTMVGRNSVIEKSDLTGSLVGSNSQVRFSRGHVSVVDGEELIGD